jgi:hypothetical protein
MPFNGLRTVPWFETTGVDKGERAPTSQARSSALTEEAEGHIKARLRALGYR